MLGIWGRKMNEFEDNDVTPTGDFWADVNKEVVAMITPEDYNLSEVYQKSVYEEGENDN